MVQSLSILQIMGRVAAITLNNKGWVKLAFALVSSLFQDLFVYLLLG